MKKKVLTHGRPRSRVLNSAITVMKLTFFLVLVTCLQLSAKVHSQKITLHVQGASLPKVLSLIESQTSYHFLFSDRRVKDKVAVDLAVNDQDLFQVLDNVLGSANLHYQVLEGNLIAIVAPPTEAAASAVSDIGVRGRVVDDKGIPLPGVSVKVRGATTGRLTDANGYFDISVPGDAVLEFTYIGYEKQTISVTGRTQFQVTMKATAQSVNEVVVIGYGTQRRQDVNGSVSTIRAEDFANVPQTSVDQLMQGRAAGVSVTSNSGQPGSVTSVRIRGVTSITGNNEPLYVIDGVPISGDGNNRSTSGVSPLSGPQNLTGGGQTAVSPLAAINPSDIVAIDILKDASATAIYGSRASNGVVIITTKRGRYGSARINYDGYYGLQEPSKYLDVMKLPAYAKLQNDLADVYGIQKRQEFSDLSLLGPGTDWQRAIFRPASMQNHQLAVSGGKEGVNYYISGSYLDQDGIVIGSNFKRYSVRSNIDGQIKDWFKLGMNFSVSRTDERITLNDLREGIVYLSLLSAPETPVYNADGSFAGPPDPSTTPSAVDGFENPVAKALSIRNTLQRNNIFGNIYAEILFTKDLSFRTEVGGDFNFNDNIVFKPTYAWGKFVNTVATLYEGKSNGQFTILKNYFNYNHSFGANHHLTALLGHEAQVSRWDGISATRQGFYSNDVQAINAGGTDNAANSGYKGSAALESYYARAIYSFRDKYGITATIRADGSSKFDPVGNNQWGYFPSFAASWKLYQEPFMKNVNAVVNNLRVKAGYGEVGNQDISNYLYGASLLATPTGLGSGFLVNNIKNPALKWESATQTNVGLDFSLFKDRLNVTVEGYNKLSRNFLYQLPLPVYLSGGPSYAGGVNPPYVNLGKMQNKGYDITVGYHNQPDAGKVGWSSTLTFSHYRNNVKELYLKDFDITKTLTSGFISFPITRTIEGQPMGLFYGYKAKGLFQDKSEFATAPKQFGMPYSTDVGGNWLGDVRYADVNKDSVVDERDRTFIGSPHPRFTFGFSNTFSYRSFDLTVFLQGSYGNKILNLVKVYAGGLDRTFTNQFASVADYWTPDHTNTNTPRPRSGDDNPNLFISDRYIEDGSYLRVQNLSLGYNLPVSLLNRAHISRLKVYVSAQNLYTFTKYSGYDPEVGAYNQDPLQTGVDNGRYPSARTYTIGLNAEF